MTAYASGRFGVRLEDMLGPTAIYMPAVTVSFQPDADVLFYRAENLSGRSLTSKVLTAI